MNRRAACYYLVSRNRSVWVIEVLPCTSPLKNSKTVAILILQFGLYRHTRFLLLYM